MDELEQELQRADEAIAARQSAAKNLEAELTGSSEVQANPRTRSWFTDVAASAARGPLKMLQAVGRLTNITGDVRLNIGNDRPLIEVRSPAEATRINREGSDSSDKILNAGLDTLGTPETKTGQFAESATQFISGMVPVARIGTAANILQGASRAITAIRGIAFGATASAVAFEGHEANLANLVEAFPSLKNPVTDFLATDEDDSEVVGRLKNAVTDAGGGVIFEGFFSALRGVKAMRKAKPQGTPEVPPEGAPVEPRELDVESTPKFTEESPEALALADDGPIPAAPAKGDQAAVDAANARADTLTLEGEERTAAEVTQLEQKAAQADAVAASAKREIDRSKVTPAKELSSDEQYDALRQRLGITDEKLEGFRQQVIKGEIQPEELVNVLGINPDRINWSSVTDVEDMTGLLNAMSKLADDAAGKAGYARVSVETTAKLASEIGGNMDEAISLWERLQSGKGVEAGVLAQRVTLMASAARLQRLAKRIAAGAHTPQDLLDFFRHDKMHALLQTTVRGTRAMIGRALRIMREGVEVNEGALKLANGRRLRTARKATESAQRAKAAAAAKKEVSAAQVKAKAAEQKALSFEEQVEAAHKALDDAHDSRMQSEKAKAKAATKEAAKVARAEAREAKLAVEKAEREAKRFEDLNGKDFDKQVGVDVNLSSDMKLQLSEVEEALKGMGLRSDDVIDLAKRYADDPDLMKVNQKSRTGLFMEATTRLGSLYINNILSGLPTMAVNVTSGLYKMVESVVENYGSYALGTLRGADKFDRMAALKSTVATFTTWRGAWKAAGAAWKEGLPQTDIMARHEVAVRGGGAITGNKVADAILTSPSRAIMTIDEFFKHMFYQQELTARAVEVAAESARLQPKNQVKHFEQVLKETLDSPTDDLVLDAIEQARYNTFQGDLESTFAKWLQHGTNEVPLLRFVIPFVKTPLNILKQGIVERSPLALASKKLRQEMLAGGRKGRTAVARMLLGTSAIALTWQAAGEGKVTGSKVGTKGNLNTADLGALPYSRKIGDKWYQYNRLDPMGTVLGLTADLRIAYDALADRADNNIESDDPQLTEAFSNLITILNENITDKTFFKGISDAMNALNGEEGAGDYYVTSLTSNLVPFSSLQRNFAKAHDEYAREAWTHMDKLLANIPFASETLAPQRDILGRPVKNAERLGPDWVSPFLVGKADSDPAAKALAEIEMPYRKPDKNIAGVKLDAKQYSRLLEVRGSYVREQLNDWIKSGEWSSLTKYQKIDKVQRWFTTATREAEAAVFTDWPELDTNVQARKQEARALRSGELQ